jgi:conjugative transfer signal peptidase TraF
MRRRSEGSGRGEEARVGGGGGGGRELHRCVLGRRYTLAGFLLATWLAFAAPHLRFNLSPCVPRGVYYLTYGEAVRAGQLVLACPPARAAELALQRHYLLAGSCPGGTKPIGKLVAALAGDRLELAIAGISVNGQALSSTAILADDSEGRPLPRQPLGKRVVAAGEVWVLSAHARSFDSRYFGPIGAGQVLGTMTPLMTAGGVDPTILAGEIRRAHDGGGRGARCPGPSGPRSWPEATLGAEGALHRLQFLTYSLQDAGADSQRELSAVPASVHNAALGGGGESWPTCSR